MTGLTGRATSPQPRDDLLDGVRSRWAALTGVPVSFPGTGLVVVTAPRSLLCPPGWVGVVVLGGSCLVTTPDDDTSARLRRRLSDIAVGSMTDPEALGRMLPLDGTLGPAALSYLDAADFRSPSVGSERVAPDDDDLAALLGAAGTDDAAESGLVEVTSPVFVVRDGTTIAAASGYRVWPGSVAHLGVLTAPAHRGRGLARTVAAAAVAHALSSGLLPQWRARPAASQRVAEALGFRSLGSQISVRPTP